MAHPTSQSVPQDHSTSQRPNLTPKTRVNLPSNAIAGVAAGFMSSAVTHPLDVVKTRFQVQDGKSHIPKYKSTFNALSTILRTEGVRTLYAGFAPNLVGSTVSWGCYFYGYNYMRGHARQQPQLVDSRGQLGPVTNMLCATCAGVFTCLATNPIWLVKTRLQLQYGSQARMNGMIDALVKVVQYEGFAGLYKGLFPSLLLVSHGALQFMAYEEIKKMLQQHHGDKEHLTTTESFLTGAAAKVFASSATYPSQVVRSRLQQIDPNVVIKMAKNEPLKVQEAEKYYHGTADVVVKIWRRERIAGFYKGLAPNLLRVVPSAAITFAVYEHVAQLLGAKT